MNPPTPEELAAFADGTLDPEQSAAIEAWLSRHPESRKDVELAQQLLHLFQQTQPADLPAGQHRVTLARIEARLAEQAAAMPPRPMVRRTVWAAVALASAVALVSFWLMARTGWAPLPSTGEEEDEPYPVVSADEVTIISMETADTDALVVGHPPIADNYEFATPADVSLVKIERAANDERLPQMQQGEVPMLFAPDVLVSNRGE